MYRDMLVHVDGGQAGRERVRFSVDFAARLGARLSGLHVTPPVEVAPRYKPSRISEVAAEISAHLASDARAAAIIFREETARSANGASWFETAGDIAQGISDKARYADLVIIGQYEWQGSPEAHPLPVAHQVVLRCGRPVLVMPAIVKPNAFARIAVAWDGSREAVRAVHDALPLLRLAQSIQVVTMISPAAEVSEDDVNSLSMHLANHGIEVRTNAVQVETAEEPELLRKQIEQGRYDFLVMGGYSHPMWMEFIFGGATRTMLLSSTIPVLVSH